MTPCSNSKPALRSVAGGTGHAILVGGEAGIGKTRPAQGTGSDSRRDAQTVVGAHCDALQTPHPLAPLPDIARMAAGGRFSFIAVDQSSSRCRAVRSRADRAAAQPRAHAGRDRRRALGRRSHLDLLRFLCRRIDSARCLLAVSYRDDELAPAHPLRRMLGELPGASFSRVWTCSRLSPDAVDRLARGALRSPAGIHAATHGNPLFVTELLQNSTRACRATWRRWRWRGLHACRRARGHRATGSGGAHEDRAASDEA